MTDKLKEAERVAFEAWARPSGFDLRRNEILGHYASLDTTRAWEGWQARAALAQQDAQAVPQGYKLIDADELRHIVRDVNQHIEQAVASEALEASRRPGYGTGIHTHIQNQMRKISAMLAAAPTLPAVIAKPEGPAT